MTKSPRLVSSRIVTSGILRAAQLQEISAPRLLVHAERLYLARDAVRLSQVADELSNFAHPGAQAARDFYRAMVLYRAGNRADALPLIVSASECEHAPRFRARAIQVVGVEYQHRSEHAEAIRICREAMKAGRAASDIIAFVRGGLSLSEIHSIEGNHEAALDGLRAIRAAVETLGKIEPFYLHLFANEAAFELLQVGRSEEARRFAAFAVASPFARAYPEWLETAQEIEQQAEAKAAHKSILRVEVRPARSTARKRPARTLFLVLKLTLKVSRRRLQPRIAIFTRELPRSRPTLEQVSLKIKIRAPSFKPA